MALFINGVGQDTFNLNNVDIDNLYVDTVLVWSSAYTFEAIIHSPVEPVPYDLEGGTVDIVETEPGVWYTTSYDNITRITWTNALITDNDITYMNIINMSTVTNLNQMFTSHRVMTGIRIGGSLHPSVTDVSELLSGCLELVYAELDIDLSQATNFYQMFQSCSKMTCITKINTLNQTNTTSMFSNCDLLTNPNASEQTAILAGSNYVNANECPQPGIEIEYTMGDFILDPTEIEYTMDSFITDGTAYTVVPDLYSFGTDTRAAYGGSVEPVILHVDTLTGSSNTDPTHGSFKWCVTQTYPRIIVFDVSGLIVSTESINLYSPYCSILGQTAPAPIAYYGESIFIGTTDVLIQHMAFRSNSTQEGDIVSIVSNNYVVDNIVIDHCSITWGYDECLGVAELSPNTCDNVTIANSIIGDSALHADHNFGSLSYGANTAFINVLFCNHKFRVPNVGISYTATPNNVACYNNVVYNWLNYLALLGGDSTDDGTQEVTYIGNVAKSGPDSSPGTADYQYPVSIGSSVTVADTSIIYMEDNKVDDVTHAGDHVFDNAGFGWDTPTTPLLPDYTPMSSADTFDYVMANVGSRPASRDDVDTATIAGVVNGTGTWLDNRPSAPTMPTQPVPFVPVANPHEMYDANYTNLENQAHQLSDVVEGK